MEDTITLTNESSKRNQQGSDSIDDEYSTDSGCSSGSSSGSSSGGSTSSDDHHPRCRKADDESVSSHRRRNSHLQHVDGHYHHEPITTRSQERLSRSKHPGHRGHSSVTSRSYSLTHAGSHMEKSPSYSSSPSDGHSTDSDLSKKASKPEIIRRALQCLKLGKNEDDGCKEKKLTKKSPRRILREPVLYTYVRGLSGLPTQRIPRNNTRAIGISCGYQDNFSRR